MKAGKVVALLIATNVVSVWVTYEVFREQDESLVLARQSQSGSASQDTVPGNPAEGELGAAASTPSQDFAAEYKAKLMAATEQDEFQFLARQYAESLTAEEARDAIHDWLEDDNQPRMFAVLTHLYKKWAEIDSYAATHSAFDSLKDTSGFQRGQIIGGALNRLGIEQADKAVEFINEKLLKSDSSISMFGLSFGEVSKELIELGDYDSLEIWIQQFDRMKNKAESRMLSYRFSDGIGLGLKYASLSEAERVLGRFPEGDLRNRAIDAFVKHSEQQSSRELAEWSLQQDLESDENDRVLASLVRKWAKEEGGFEDVFTYINGLENADSLDNSISALYYTSPKDDYEIRFELMNAIKDSKVRDRVALNFASAATDLDVESRLSVAMSINNKSNRARSIEKLLLQVAEQNVDQAFTKLDSINSELLDAKSAGEIREKLEHERQVRE